MKQDINSEQDIDLLNSWAEQRNDSEAPPEVIGTEDQELRTDLIWPPSLGSKALFGLAGEVVSRLEPHSEADPVGLLMHFLVAFGNVVGRNAHFVVGGTRHHANLFCVNVGATASRKGTAKDDTFFVLRNIDSEWFGSRIQSGLSSGEGFIWAVRDAVEERQPIKERGRVVDYDQVVTDPGISDKRLLIVESEFGSTLRVLGREGNTLSAQLRQAWDSGTLRVLTKTKPVQSTDAHVSILGHVTREELLKYLNATEQANGFANRILWTAVKRSKLLPDGGAIHELKWGDIQADLSEVLAFASSVEEVRRSPEARELWHAIYPQLVGDRVGLFGAVTSRAEAQTMRLALVYALLDRSSVIECRHLEAALAVWAYCQASALSIFGEASGDSTADDLLGFLRSASKPVSRTEISNFFGRNKTAAEINRALSSLVRRGLIAPETVVGSGGRSSEY